MLWDYLENVNITPYGLDKMLTKRGIICFKVYQKPINLSEFFNSQSACGRDVHSRHLEKTFKVYVKEGKH